MSRKRKIPENEAQPRIVFFQQLLNKLGKFPARWTLEIAELFQCDGSVGVAANVRRIGVGFCQNTLAFGDVLKLLSLCAI